MSAPKDQKSPQKGQKFAPKGGSKSWLLDPHIAQLNHGSFGATPRPVLDEQDRWRRLMEANPTGFVLETFESALDEARARLSAHEQG